MSGTIENAYLFLFKITPFALIFDHVTLEGLWVRHRVYNGSNESMLLLG